jgi:hypothetical protein
MMPSTSDFMRAEIPRTPSINADQSLTIYLNAYLKARMTLRLRHLLTDCSIQLSLFTNDR